MASDLISDMPVKMQKESQEWHRTLRDKALDKLHLEASPAVVGVAGKPVPVQW
jgi:sulfur carrier protein ThiS